MVHEMCWYFCSRRDVWHAHSFREWNANLVLVIVRPCVRSRTWQPSTNGSKTCVNLKLISRPIEVGSHDHQVMRLIPPLKTQPFIKPVWSPSTFIYHVFGVKIIGWNYPMISQWNYIQDTCCVKSDSFSTLLTNQDLSVTLIRCVTKFFSDPC